MKPWPHYNIALGFWQSDAHYHDGKELHSVPVYGRKYVSIHPPDLPSLLTGAATCESHQRHAAACVETAVERPPSHSLDAATLLCYADAGRG